MPVANNVLLTYVCRCQVVCITACKKNRYVLFCQIAELGVDNWVVGNECVFGRHGVDDKELA